MDFNKILIGGRLTRDPQLSYLPSNTPVVEIGVATSRKFKRQDGEKGDETLFVDCRAFGRTAEVINQHFQKGKPIFIEGRLQLDKWKDKTDTTRSKYRVFIESFQFLGGREQSPQQHTQQGGGGSIYPDGPDEDIPFHPQTPEDW